MAWIMAELLGLLLVILAVGKNSAVYVGQPHVRPLIRNQPVSLIVDGGGNRLQAFFRPSCLRQSYP
jgi:hypothetical protein